MYERHQMDNCSQAFCCCSFVDETWRIMLSHFQYSHTCFQYPRKTRNHSNLVEWSRSNSEFVSIISYCIKTIFRIIWWWSFNDTYSLYTEEHLDASDGLSCIWNNSISFRLLIWNEKYYIEKSKQAVIWS